MFVEGGDGCDRGEVVMLLGPEPSAPASGLRTFRRYRKERANDFGADVFAEHYVKIIVCLSQKVDGRQEDMRAS